MIFQQKHSQLIKLSTSFIIIIIFFALSVQLRSSTHKLGLNYSNYDATWHVLLTLNAMAENPFRTHLGLPIVTLGGEENKGYWWGSTVSTEAGNFLYTSFPSLGFFIPYATLRLLNQPMTFDSLIFFNFGIHLLTTFGIFFVTKQLLFLVKSNYIYVGAVLLSICYLFTTETLLSHGVIYWSHSLFQLVFIVYLLLILQILTTTRRTLPELFLNALFCFLLASIDWTGYLIAFISGVVLFIMASGTRKQRLSHLLSAWFGAAAALIYFAGTFLMLIPQKDFIKALLSRFLSRSFNIEHTSSLFTLAKEYISSFTFALMLLSGVIMLLRRRNRHPALIAFTVITGFALIENIIMMHHAISYSFDRLKLFFLLIPGFILLWNQSRWSQILVTGVCALTIVYSANIYTSDTPFIRIPEYFLQNEYIRKDILRLNDKGSSIHIWDISNQLQDNVEIRAGLPTSDVVLGTNNVVRGYMNLDWHRSILETVLPIWTSEVAQSRGKNRWIFIETSDMGNQVFHYRSIIYYDGAEITLRYLTDNPRFEGFSCGLMENTTRVHVCSGQDIRTHLSIPVNGSLSEVIVALDNFYRN